MRRQVPAQIALSLPTIHCAACISKIERALNDHPQVTSARVNLTLKRASIDAAPQVTAAEMVQLVEGLGYEAHELDTGTLNATATDKAGRDLLMRLAVAGFASMNVMLLSVAVWSGAEAATRDLFHWISAAIALPTIAFAGQPFFRNAWAALRNRQLNMDVPITLAILLAIVTSLWETTLSGEHAYFDAALTLTFFLLAGRYLDHRTRAVARSAAEELTALEVPRAIRLEDGQEHEVRLAELAVGDIILVRPGGRMPVDGEIVTGTSELDRSLLTGETLADTGRTGAGGLGGRGQPDRPADHPRHGGRRRDIAAPHGRSGGHRRIRAFALHLAGGQGGQALRARRAYPGSALSFVGWYLYSWRSCAPRSTSPPPC